MCAVRRAVRGGVLTAHTCPPRTPGHPVITQKVFGLCTRTFVAMAYTIPPTRIFPAVHISICTACWMGLRIAHCTCFGPINGCGCDPPFCTLWWAPHPPCKAPASGWLGVRGGCCQPIFEGPCAKPYHGHPLPAPSFSLLAGGCFRESFEAITSLGQRDARRHLDPLTFWQRSDSGVPPTCRTCKAETGVECRVCGFVTPRPKTIKQMGKDKTTTSVSVGSMRKHAAWITIIQQISDQSSMRVKPNVSPPYSGGPRAHVLSTMIILDRVSAPTCIVFMIAFSEF